MVDKQYTLSDFDFTLPDELIAQYPLDQRDKSRLFVYNRQHSTHTHTHFDSLSSFIEAGDLLVFNDARVIHARIYCLRKTGAHVEVILTQKLPENNRWLIISNRTKRLKLEEELVSEKDNDIKFRIIGRIDEFLEIETSTELTDEILMAIGEIPLPPYMKRSQEEIDETRYQTVYAQSSGAVAAPTAGLHFSDELLNSLKVKGVNFAFLTLLVSWGTFQPVRHEDIDSHKMHTEVFHLSSETAGLINETRKNKKRVIAVGTTSLRVLETTFENDKNIPGSGKTDIFIRPPYKIQSIDALLTNFHTPRSTLLMLVSSFAGYDNIKKIYKVAVDEKYRFFSYGDSMLIT